MRLHYQEPSTLSAAPNYLKSQYHSQGLDGTRCGFVRKVTYSQDKVTYKSCLKLMKNGILIKPID